MAYELINHGPVTPHRMHALIRLLARAEEWDRSEVLALVQPSALDAKQQAAKDVLTALRSLELIVVEDNALRLRNDAKCLVDLEMFRRSLMTSVARARSEDDVNYRFSLFTAWYATRNEEVITSGNDELTVAFNTLIPFGGEDRAMNSTKLNAWRTWADFLGYGWLYSGKLVPDATTRLRAALEKALPEDGKVPFAEFVSRLAVSCPELDHGDLFRFASTHGRAEPPGNRLSLMLSNALRRLHDEETVVLSTIPDARDTWQLFPASGFSLEAVTHIRRGAQQ